MSAILGLVLCSNPAAADSFTLPLPGTLLRAVAVQVPAGRSGIALLVAAGRDGKGAKSLLFLDPEKRALERLAGGLHEEVNALAAFDLAGNGSAVPIAGMPGVLFTPAGGEAARKVLQEPDVDLRSVAGATAGRPWLPVARTGLLELLRIAPGGGLARGASFPLPVRAERLRWGLRLASPPVTLLNGDPPLFAAGPEAVGRRRLQTLLLPAAAGEPTEAWSLLPADERLTSDRRYLRLDGVPVLAATTLGKIGILAKKRLRLFVLERDRSRKGRAPSFACETECPLWHPLDVMAVETDGDGRKDLALIHPGGLRGKELLASTYHGLGGGRFNPQPRRWKLNDEASDWLYGADLTADGVPDLLVLVKDRLLLYAGDPRGSRPLAGRPVWSVAVSGAPKKDKGDERDESTEEASLGPEREHLLMAFELPGGGRLALMRGAQKDGKTVLTVVRR
ncbi:MAG TPA: VCBS repeat-containing protein [Thermoanaerobaculia bacterium]|nr:VCBS repeat-containing protein [Thermoanaerobaculia bacterium]